MRASTRILLEGILDYAGTFPPAGLPLAEALANYGRDTCGGDGWMMGRLVVPAASLPDLERIATSVLPSGDGRMWPLSVVLGGQPADSLEEALDFNPRTATAARVESVEFPPVEASGIHALMRRVPNDIEAFFEVPLDGDIEPRVAAIAGAGALAKLRTGGVTAAAIPSPDNLTRFLACCSDAGVAFKATAGLHHAVRGCYALTYEPQSPKGTMYGFLNVCVAAGLARSGADASEIVEALTETAAGAFSFRDDGLRWRSRVIGVEQLAETRRRFFRSFGSCSFREPVDELAALLLS